MAEVSTTDLNKLQEEGTGLFGGAPAAPETPETAPAAKPAAASATEPVEGLSDRMKDVKPHDLSPEDLAALFPADAKPKEPQVEAVSQAGSPAEDELPQRLKKLDAEAAQKGRELAGTSSPTGEPPTEPPALGAVPKPPQDEARPETIRPFSLGELPDWMKAPAEPVPPGWQPTEPEVPDWFQTPPAGEDGRDAAQPASSLSAPEAPAPPESQRPTQEESPAPAPGTPPEDHRETPVDNSEFLTEISGLSDAARKTLLNVPLDANDMQSAVDALYDAGLNEDEVRGAIIEVLGALNLRAAQTAPAVEAPAGPVPEPEVAPETVEAEAPAESAAVPEEDELSKLAKELGLNEQVKNALTGVDLSDVDAVSAALDQAGVFHRERYQLLPNIVRRPSTEAPALAAVSQPEAGRRMPKLELPPRVATALQGVDLRNTAAVKAALAKFGAGARAQATEQLARFRLGVDTLVAKMPRRQPREVGTVPPQGEGPTAEVVTESRQELQDAEAGEGPQADFSRRMAAVLRRVQTAADPDVLAALRQQSVRAYREALVWRPELGRQDVRAAEEVLLSAVKKRAVQEGGSLGSEPQEFTPEVDAALRAYRKQDVDQKTPERERRAKARKRLQENEAAARMVEPSTVEQLTKKGSAFEQELRGLSKFFNQIGTLKELQSDLESARRDAKYANGKKQRSAQATMKEIEARIVAYPTSVDDLFQRLDFPAGLRQAILAERKGDTVPYGEQGAVGEHRRALYRGILDDLGVQPRRASGSPEAAEPTETPASGREGEADSTRAPTPTELSEMNGDEKKIKTYAEAIRAGKADPQKVVEFLSDPSTEHEHEIQALGAAVDQLARELQDPNANAQQSAQTKENLKKLGLALAGIAGIATLAGVLAIVAVIEGAIGETLKVAGS